MLSVLRQAHLLARKAGKPDLRLFMQQGLQECAFYFAPAGLIFSVHIVVSTGNMYLDIGFGPQEAPPSPS